MKEETRTDRFLVAGVILLVFLVFLSKLLPPSPTSITVLNEELLKRTIEQKEKEIGRLQKVNWDLGKDVDSLKEVAQQKAEVVTIIKPIYREAVEATDLLPDSLNLSKEVNISRKIIKAQEAHINALLALNLKADSLLAVRLEIIKGQQEELGLWRDRFDNMVAQKDDLIKKERRRGHKKFFKGALVGGLIVAILAL